MTDLSLEWIIRAKRDPEAFRVVYQHYLPRIYAYTAARVGHRQDSEDIVADVFVKVVTALPKFEPRGEGAFTAWIFRIAHNAIAQFYRDKPPPEITWEDLPDIVCQLPLPDEAYQRQEVFLQIQQLLQSLPTRRREVVLLRFYGGLRNQEIATVLGLDERTVASHLSRALDELHTRYHALLQEMHE